MHVYKQNCPFKPGKKKKPKKNKKQKKGWGGGGGGKNQNPVVCLSHRVMVCSLERFITSDCNGYSLIQWKPCDPLFSNTIRKVKRNKGEPENWSFESDHGFTDSNELFITIVKIFIWSLKRSPTSYFFPIQDKR